MNNIVVYFFRQVGYPPFWNERVEFLLLSILQGNYTFPSPYWDTVSESAKDLIRKLVSFYLERLRFFKHNYVTKVIL